MKKYRSFNEDSIEIHKKPINTLTNQEKTKQCVNHVDSLSLASFPEPFLWVSDNLSASDNTTKENLCKYGGHVKPIQATGAPIQATGPPMRMQAWESV